MTLAAGEQFNLERLMMQPRFIRMMSAPAYLGMCRAEFNSSVRPNVREFPIGKQGIAFDRKDLDNWADFYAKSHSVEKNQRKEDNTPAASASSSITEQRQWHAKVSPASRKPRAASGASTKKSLESDFGKALAQAKGLKRKST
jgi:predicted DNA-binding transcriptional regulator AlpA